MDSIRRPFQPIPVSLVEGVDMKAGEKLGDRGPAIASPIIPILPATSVRLATAAAINSWKKRLGASEVPCLSYSKLY